MLDSLPSSSPQDQPPAYRPTEADLAKYKKMFEGSQSLMELARLKMRDDWAYYDGVQWTEDERKKLKARNQPDTVFNRIKPAINGTIGVVERGRTDPKAWARNPEDENASEIATDSLRYVCDKARFQQFRSRALKDFLVSGICGVIIEVDDDREIVPRKIRAEEYFYDSYSREEDFKDARYNGIAKWMDEDDAVLMFKDVPNVESIIGQSISNIGVGSTWNDRPQAGWAWADPKMRRLMVVEMYHRDKGIWMHCIFVSGGILKFGPSEYLDEKKRPRNPIVAQSAYVDLDNQRYGAVRDMRGPQDGINKSRSKALDLLTRRQVRVSRRVKDAQDVSTEVAKANGIIVGDKDEVEILPTQDLVPSHLELMRDSKSEIERQAPNPAILGRTGQEQSGRAILALQQAGLIELSPLLSAFDDWTLRCYRHMWATIKQFWTAPQYIRVTDDENAPKYVMVNKPVYHMGSDGNAIFDTSGQPIVKGMENNLGQMDVDIIIDSSPDTASLQEEQYSKLIEMAQIPGNNIPFELILEASSLPNKRLLMDKLEKLQQQQAQQPPSQQAALEIQGAKAKTENIEADTVLKLANATQLAHSIGQNTQQSAFEAYQAGVEVATGQFPAADQSTGAPPAPTASADQGPPPIPGPPVPPPAAKRKKVTHTFHRDAMGRLAGATSETDIPELAALANSQMAGNA